MVEFPSCDSSVGKYYLLSTCVNSVSSNSIGPSSQMWYEANEHSQDLLYSKQQQIPLTFVHY